MSSAQDEIAARVAALLRGRQPYVWGRWVGVSGGLLDRLRKGQLPDPVKLAGAMRAENLSLTWLVEGAGPPHLVVSCISVDDAQEMVSMDLEDEPSLQLMIVRDDRGRAVLVLHQPAEVVTSLGVTVAYTSVRIFVGQVDGGPAASRYRDRATDLTLEADAWQRLATGHMSTSELFGWPGEPGGGLARTRRAVDMGLALSEPTPQYRRGDGEIEELLAALTDADRAAVLHLIRSLAR